jgi:hypothetical protein
VNNERSNEQMVQDAADRVEVLGSQAACIKRHAEILEGRFQRARACAAAAREIYNLCCTYEQAADNAEAHVRIFVNKTIDAGNAISCALHSEPFVKVFRQLADSQLEMAQVLEDEAKVMQENARPKPPVEPE